MKIVSWNVNGLRAIVGKGFEGIVAEFDSDIFCVQEIKLRPGQLNLELAGYEAYYSYADRPGYSGTAVFTRLKPLSHASVTGVDRHDHEGRVTLLELDDRYLVNVYTPNSQSELARLDYRLDWERDFLSFVRSLDAHKPVVVCGDLNVAHREIDLANPRSNRNNPGFTDAERAAMDRFLEAGFIDTFRHLNPDLAGAYSWWSYRGQARAKNVGWRIDYFIISERLLPKLRLAAIHPAIVGSDHCPVSVVLD